MQKEIVYKFGAEINPDDLVELFRGTTWADGRTADDIMKMLRNSPLHLSAWQNGKLVGFMRAITDDVYRAVLDDLVVGKELRKQGIGKSMMEQMLQRLQHVEEISLDCEDDLLDYYKKFGFLPELFNCLRVWREKS